MIKFYAHSLFSITFFVVRFFILDAAASPAYAKAEMHQPDPLSPSNPMRVDRARTFWPRLLLQTGFEQRDGLLNAHQMVFHHVSNLLPASGDKRPTLLGLDQ